MLAICPGAQVETIFQTTTTMGGKKREFYILKNKAEIKTLKISPQSKQFTFVLC